MLHGPSIALNRSHYSVLQRCELVRASQAKRPYRDGGDTEVPEIRPPEGRQHAREMDRCVQEGGRTRWMASAPLRSARLKRASWARRRCTAGPRPCRRPRPVPHGSTGLGCSPTQSLALFYAAQAPPRSLFEHRSSHRRSSTSSDAHHRLRRFVAQIERLHGATPALLFEQAPCAAVRMLEHPTSWPLRRLKNAATSATQLLHELIPPPFHPFTHCTSAPTRRIHPPAPALLPHPPFNGVGASAQASMPSCPRLRPFDVRKRHHGACGSWDAHVGAVS